MECITLAYVDSQALENCVSFDVDEGANPIVLESSERYDAVSAGTALTIILKSSNEIISEIDFDSSIVGIAWAVGDKCLVLADSAGMLHLVTVDGTVLFSKRVASAGEAVCAVQFLRQASEDGDDQQLMAATDKGALIVIRHMNIEAICSAASRKSGELPGLLQRLQIQKTALAVPDGGISSIRFAPYGVESTLVLVTSFSNELYSVDVATVPSLTASGTKRLGAVQNTSCSCCVVNAAGPSDTDPTLLVLALTGDQVVTVLGDAVDGTDAAICALTAPAQQLAVLAHDQMEGLTLTLILAGPHNAQAASNDAAQVLLLLSTGAQSKLLHLGSSDLPEGRLLVESAASAVSSRCLVVKDETALVMATSASLRALWGKICSAVRSSLLADGPPGMQSGLTVLVRMAAVALNVPQCTGAASDVLLDEFKNFSSGPEVMCALSLALDFPSPPAGHMEKTLSCAEASVERLSAKLGQGVKQRYLLDILKTRHILETVEMLSGAEAEDSAGEEHLRTGMRSLLPRNLGATLRGYLRSGRVKEALLVAQRCVRGALPVDPRDAVRLVSESAPADDVLVWIKRGVVPRLLGDCSGVTAVVEELLQRAAELEKRIGNPFEALKYLSLAKELSSSLGLGVDTGVAPLQAQVETLHGQLSLQKALWELWQDEITLEEVAELGLKGVIFDRLDSADERTLLTDLEENVRPLVEQFRGNLDLFLTEWVEETISRKIVLAGGYDDAAGEGDDEGNCTLSRLVLVASAICNRNIQAKIVLTLMQMPVLEDICLQDAADGAKRAGTVTGHTASTRLLCDLALRAVDYIDGATRDALTEATKLLRIKALAADYGVENFDPRNSKQVRATVIIIASSLHRENSVRDAVEFASSWGSKSVDMASVLTRAVIQRCLNRSTVDLKNAKFEEDIKGTLSHLPEELTRVVLDDALSFLLDDLDEVSQEIDFDPAAGAACGAQAKGTYTESTFRAQMDVRAAIVLAAHYLDVTRANYDFLPTVPAVAAVEDSTNISGDAKQKERSSVPEARDSWISAELLSRLRRIATLQTSHHAFLSVEDLTSAETCQAIVAKCAAHRVKLLLAAVPAGNEVMPAEASPLDAHSRKACTLLNVCPTFFTHTAMKLLVDASRTELAMEVAKSLSQEKIMHSTSLAQLLVNAQDGGVMAGGSSSSSSGGVLESDAEAEREAELLLDAATTLCTIAAKKANQARGEDYSMLPSLSLLTADVQAQVPEHLSFPIASFSLSRDLLRYSVSSCPSAYMGRTVDLLSGAETVLAVYERVEDAHMAEADAKHGLALILADGVFARDGILMQASAVAMPLMKFAFGELKRRSTQAVQHKSGGKAAAARGATDLAAPDLDDLVRVLQRTENHVLATRILYGSKHNGTGKAQALNASLLALCRKVLIYRDIDIPFSVASLAALPYESMVKELKLAVPSIQSDFSRLQTVAMVGEELSHLWDQETLLLLFQGLQSNAKWWHILSSLGMKVDLKVFQSSDAAVRDKFIRSIVPELFERSAMDLEMVSEYCRQFDLEPEYASLTYAELLLTATPTSPADFTWAGKVRAAVENVHDRSLLQRLRDVLHRICPLDYEKIRFVCTWITDLLAAEDSPEDAFGEESDYTTSSFAARKSRRAGDVVTAIAERGVAHELETYNRYLGIVAYLASLKFPRSATAAIPYPEGVPSPYRGVGNVYQERIPLWPLMEDPWSVLDALLTALPESAVKLAPLCGPLRLDKSDFNVRKIIALYSRMTSATGAAAAVSVEVRSASYVEGKRAAMAAASEAIDISLIGPLQQMELWHWIYERELKAGDDDNALAALQTALSIANQNANVLMSQSNIKPSTQSADGSAGDGTMLTYFSEEMRTVKCRCTIRAFTASISDCPRVCAMVVASITNPPALVRYMFEVMLSVCWDLQMQDATKLGTPVTSFSLSQCTPGKAMMDFVSTSAAAINEISRHCGLDQASPATSPTGSAAAQTTQLELLRYNLIGRMLSDVDTSNSGEGSGAAATAGILAGGARKGLWDAGAEVSYNPGEADQRRREDIYLSQSIAAVVMSCSSSAQREAYVSQLDSVMRGKGVRVMRRLTARSKYRAAQALSFLQTARISSDATEVKLYRSFLYCLCELQEIRLPCSEQSLLDAMGLKFDEYKISSASAEPSRVFAAADPRSLVRTWLHDEGAHVEVVELARDLLVVTDFQETGAWHLLMGHMAARGMHRSLFETLLLIHSSPAFADLSFGMMGAEMLNSLAKTNAEAITRAEQVLTLSALRDGSASTTPPEWLHLSDIGPGSSGAAGTVMVIQDNKTADPATQASQCAQRVYLGTRLAGRPGAWEEGAPEDLIPTLRFSSSLAAAVLHAISSRVRTRCQPAIAALRANVARSLAVLSQFEPASDSERRSVYPAVISAVHGCVRDLLAPAVFCSAGASATQTAALLLAALSGVPNPSAHLATSVLAITAENFDEEVGAAVLNTFLASKSPDKVRVLVEHSCTAQLSFLRVFVRCLQDRTQSSEDIAAVKQALAALPSSSRRQLMLRMSKLGKSAAALIAALV